MSKGTPKTLTDAVAHQLLPIKGAPTHDDFIEARAIMRDYLAQRFNVAALRDSGSLDVIKKLWVDTINEPWPGDK